MKPSQGPLAACCGVLVAMSSCHSTSPAGSVEPTAEAPVEPPRLEAGAGAPDARMIYFETLIDAPVEEVWETMLRPDGYRRWTAAFFEGSYFAGSWEEGERMYFLAPGGSGMCAVIAENRRHELISIQHIGYVDNGVEDTTSDAVLAWAPAYENYHFASVDGGTKVTVEQEVLAGFEDMMGGVWPKALATLKAICEEE